MSQRARRLLGAETLSPWVVATLAGCASLALVDVWRDHDAGSLELLRGTWPNLVAVPTLAFGALMLRFPQRAVFDRQLAAAQDRWFALAWVAALAVTVAWELLQITGALVFDPMDLAATALGAALAWPAYRCGRRFAFRGADDD